MQPRRWIQRLVLAGTSLIFLILLVLLGFNLQTLSVANRFFTLDGGIWNPTQLEREILRLRVIANEISMGTTNLGNEFVLRRNLVGSRINILSDFYRVEREDQRSLLERSSFEVIKRDFFTLENQTRLNISTNSVQQLIPVLSNMETNARTMVNERRQIVDRAAQFQRQSLERLRITLLFILGGIIIQVPIFFLLSRRRFDTTLQQAYSTLQERSTALEQSQHELASSNTLAQQQNEALQKTLADLEKSMAERSVLETTVLRMQFPIIPLRNRMAIMPVIGNLSSERVQIATDSAAQYVEVKRIKVLLFDITGVSAIDRSAAAKMQQLLQMLRLLGCEPVLVGVTPEVAEELVHTGLAQHGLQTYANLQQAIEATAKTLE
ncbi:STAS domain-containing protein [Herpetosiphon llansteffanensis]|uniref:STAS domain-containing protein n=1 Tax=Herpetosiphon llansteffanensis TaxID=2094568 RepID=UPI000D7BCD00|nr:STAS domain-containing protein [Herpetosiphon llansteffanensis]